MPVIYYNIDELKSLERDPYKILTKRYKSLKNALEEKEIEINMGFYFLVTLFLYCRLLFPYFG